MESISLMQARGKALAIVGLECGAGCLTRELAGPLPCHVAARGASLTLIAGLVYTQKLYSFHRVVQNS